MSSQRLSIAPGVPRSPGWPGLETGPVAGHRALQQRLLAGLAARPDGMIGLALALPFCAMHCLCC